MASPSHIARTRMNPVLLLWVSLWIALAPALAQAAPTWSDRCREGLATIAHAKYVGRTLSKKLWERIQQAFRQIEKEQTQNGGKGAADKKKQGSSYQARNKPIPPPDPEADRKPVWHTATLEFGLYRERSMVDLDPDTGQMFIPRTTTVERPGSLTVGTDVLHNLDTNGNAGSALPVPVGSSPVRGSRHLGWDNYGVSETGEVRLGRETSVPTAAEIKRASRVALIPLRLFPDWIQTGIAELQARNAASRLSNKEVAAELRSLIRAHMHYAKEGSDHRGVLALSKHGECQCDGAALIWAYLMRAEFGRPARVALGQVGYQNPEYGQGFYILRNQVGHAWGEYIDEAELRWLPSDATPASEDDPRQQDQGDWKSSQSPSGEEPPKEPTKKDDSKEASEKARDDNGGTTGAFPKPPEVKELTPQRLEAAALERAMWIHLLQQLAQNPASALDEIGHFRDYLKKNRTTQSEMQYLETLAQIQQRVARLSRPHRSYSDLARQMRASRPETTQEVMANLLVVQRALQELAPLVKADAGIGNALHAIDRTLSARAVPALTSYQLKPAFERLLPGPFSVEAALNSYRDYVKENGGASLEEYLHTQAPQTVRQMAKVNEYINLSTLSDRKLVRAPFADEEGVERAENPWGVSRTNESTSPDRIRQTGLPPEIELVLARAGKLDQFAPQRYGDRTKPMPSASSLSATEIVVFDLSGSMEPRLVALHRLLAGYIDRAQKQGVKKIIFVPYSDRAMDPVVLDTAPKRKAMYDRLMAGGVYNAENGNNTAEGLKAAFKLALEDAGAKMFNIRLITDGDETFDSEEATRALKPIADAKIVNLSTLTLSVGNRSMEALAENIRALGQKTVAARVPKVIHQHLTDDQLEEIKTGGEKGERPDFVSLDPKALSAASQPMQSLENSAVLSPSEPVSLDAQFDRQGRIEALRQRILADWKR